MVERCYYRTCPACSVSGEVPFQTGLRHFRDTIIKVIGPEPNMQCSYTTRGFHIFIFISPSDIFIYLVAMVSCEKKLLRLYIKENINQVYFNILI